jgi:hypothetical protein
MLIDVSPRSAIPGRSGLERLGAEPLYLLVSLALAAACLTAAARTQFRRAEEATGPLSRGEVVVLSAQTTPEALEPILREAFASDAEASAAASRIAEFLRRHPQVPNVGALARSVSGPLLTSIQLQKVKPRLLARTPSDFRAAAVRMAWWFFAPFVLVCLLRRLLGRTGGPLLLPAAAALCGIGMSTLLAIQDQLRDTLRAAEMAWIYAAGNRHPGCESSSPPAPRYVLMSDPEARRRGL